MSRRETEQAGADVLIRQRVADYAKAISAKDIDAVMSFFAPNVVSFDLAIHDLRYVGADAKRLEWLKVFAAYRSIDYEVTDMHVTGDGDIAFVHAVNHVKGTLHSGQTAASRDLHGCRLARGGAGVRLRGVAN